MWATRTGWFTAFFLSPSAIFGDKVKKNVVTFLIFLHRQNVESALHRRMVYQEKKHNAERSLWNSWILRMARFQYHAWLFKTGSNFGLFLDSDFKIVKWFLLWRGPSYRTLCLWERLIFVSSISVVGLVHCLKIILNVWLAKCPITWTPLPVV